jgi:hypothetical protein
MARRLTTLTHGVRRSEGGCALARLRREPHSASVGRVGWSGLPFEGGDALFGLQTFGLRQVPGGDRDGRQREAGESHHKPRQPAPLVRGWESLEDHDVGWPVDHVRPDDGLMLPRWSQIETTAHRQWRSKMTATLKVTHKAIGVEVRRGTYDIVVDGKPAGSLEMNDSIEMPIERGRHTLQVRSGQKSSRTQTFEAAESQTVAFRCTGKSFLPIFLASFVVPSLALQLRREADERSL